MVTLYCALTGMRESNQIPAAGTWARQFALGSPECSGELTGWIGSFGEGTRGLATIFVNRRGSSAIYTVEGSITRETADFEFGPLGKIEVAVQPTGSTESVRSDCGGKPLTIDGAEYVGTIEFHGEGGFTTARADRAPLDFKPILDIVCPGFSAGVTSGEGVRGVQIKVSHAGGPTLQLAQNHAGAPVFYGAHLAEKRDGISISRSVSGHLGGGSLAPGPSLASASFSAGHPFSGTATYRGTRAPKGTRSGRGTWHGRLKVDFPGARHVRLAGPGFSASIIHACRTESRN
jgi:hypothetical protein